MKHTFPSYVDVPVKGRLKKCLDMVIKKKLEGKVLVDIGCSSGWLEYKLQKSSLKKIIAIDSNSEAINFAKSHVKKGNFFLSEAKKIPAKDLSVDIVVMFDVIEHVPKSSEPSTFKEINRVLKKDGRLLLSTPNNHFIANLLDPAWYLGHRHYEVKNISKMLRDSGFKIRKVEVVGRFWSLFYIVWFYLNKWFLGQSIPRNKFFEKKDDVEFKKKGFFTIFIECEKK